MGLFDPVAKLFDPPLEFKVDKPAEAMGPGSDQPIPAPVGYPGFTGLDMLLPVPVDVTVH